MNLIEVYVGAELGPVQLQLVLLIKIMLVSNTKTPETTRNNAKTIEF